MSVQRAEIDRSYRQPLLRLGGTITADEYIRITDITISYIDVDFHSNVSTEQFSRADDVSLYLSLSTVPNNPITIRFDYSNLCGDPAGSFEITTDVVDASVQLPTNR